jgi:peroxiredoxin Q/BCP
MRNMTKWGLALLTLAVFTLGSARAEEKASVAVGDKAPAIVAKDSTGKTWKSSEHFPGKVVVVYFFPADFTGGCTKQACGFRDDFKKLTDKGIQVVGISGDDVKTHAQFKKYHKLPFTLLADPEGTLAKKFGVPTRAGHKITINLEGGKTITTNPGVLASRWTFVIKDGKVIHKDTKVQAAQNSKKVLAIIEKAGK